MSQKDIETDDILNKGITEAVQMASEQMNSNLVLVPNSITATSQVVQGISYDVTIKITPEDKTNDCTVSSECPNQVYVCSFNVWSRVWMKKLEDRLIVSKPKCNKQ